MKVVRLVIERFRGVKNATLYFNGHTLLVGMNNVGKSTICEALDMVLGPDRVTKVSPVGEYDFYNAEYLAEDGVTAIPARIEVVLTDLTSEVELAYLNHIELWHTEGHRILGEGEITQANPPKVVRCLRLETIAQYDQEDDEFEANTFFSHGTNNYDGTPERVGKRLKRLFGFLYLRALRTGTRALSLERGSLLDIILRLQDIRTGLWEQSIKRLRELEPPIVDDATGLTVVLDNIEKRLAQYIPVQSQDKATRLFVSQLTRDHLRKTISFFLSTNADQRPVPFQEVGTGTLNTLVLALLSFIADIKKDNVIFAMEEPEIALPPHTQRRIANYLLNETTQCFVTSHSPYVIERFDPEQILILRRDNCGTVSPTPVSFGASLKGKLYKRHARRGLAEAMLGTGVIIAEGITEHSAINAVVEKLEESSESYYPLDLSGITILPVDGDGSLSMFGSFFKSLGLKTYAFYDNKQRKDEEKQKLISCYDFPCETAYAGIERLLINEIPVNRQWQFLASLKQLGEQGGLGIPEDYPGDEKVKDLTYQALRSNKGNGYAARLIEICAIAEVPASIKDFLIRVYADFPKPATILPPQTKTDAATQQKASTGGEKSAEGLKS